MTYEEYKEEVKKLKPEFLVKLRITNQNYFRHVFKQAEIEIIPVRVSFANGQIAMYYHTWVVSGIGRVVFRDNCYVKAILTETEFSKLTFLDTTNNKNETWVIMKDFFK